MASILSVRNLTKRFKQFTAVNSISFALEEGEILGLLGPNGAGKTTTIQMLLGVLMPTSGTITCFGKEFSAHREEILEQMNFSSTYTNLPWGLTVLENLTYTAHLYDIPDRKKRVQEVIEAFRLESLQRHELTELSAGQLTRVNLAKAFINQPKILLLDEPTASLDPEVASYVRSYIRTQREQNGLSIIFTSHNMPEVEEVCDRVMFINHGKIIADDTPENLARSLDFCRVRLLIKKEQTAALEAYCAETKKQFSADETVYTIELKEKELSRFLQDIGSRKISFLEISIDKPDLEDYFLHMAKGKKQTSMEHVI